RQFVRHRDDALFHDTRFTGLDLSTNVETTRQAALAALRLFAAPGPDGGSDPAAFTLAPLPDALSRAQREEIITGCYELLLILADPLIEPLPAPDAQHQALRILDQAARLRPPTRAYYLRRAVCLTRRGDGLGAVWASQQAAELQSESAVDHF